MALLALLAVGVIGWALWSGKIATKQLLPLVLIIAGGFLVLRGSWFLGLPAIAIGAFWFRGMTARLSRLRKIPSSEYELAAARWLLGVSAQDGPEKIRARHQKLMSENQPERGGDKERAQELDRARDALLDDLKRKKG